MREGTFKTVVKAVFALLLACTCAPAAFAADEADTFRAAGALYTKSVDLANAGNYTGALEAADEALTLNATPLTALIQANRAGILVMLNRYDEAVAAADASLAVGGNLTTAHAIAYYNKGDALNHMGRTAEAQAAFEKAYELDNTLISPLGTATPGPTRSPLSAAGALAAGITGAFLFSRMRKS